MKKSTTHIEQLFQELVSQDPSFVSQKSEILGLLERMTEHTPSVSIDPLFQNNLKSRLEHHLHYIHNLKTNPVKVNPHVNRLARLISYGLPAVALGVIIFLSLPYNPITAPIETTPNEYNSLPQEQSDSLPITTTIEDKPIIIQTKIQTLPKKENSISQEQNKLASKQDIKNAEPMMLKTISIPEGGESTISDTMMIQDNLSSQKSIPLSPTSQQIVYKNDIITLHYNLYRSGEDIQFEGMIDHCKNSYTISEYLVANSSDATIHIIAKDTSSDQEIKLTVTFKDNLISNIEGGDQCK